MTPAALAGDAHITNHTRDTPARNKDTKTLAPDLVEVIQELVIDRDVSQLARVVWIGLQRTVGWASADEVDGFRFEEREIAGIPLDDFVMGDASSHSQRQF